MFLLWKQTAYGLLLFLISFLLGFFPFFCSIMAYTISASSPNLFAPSNDLVFNPKNQRPSTAPSVRPPPPHANSKKPPRLSLSFNNNNKNSKSNSMTDLLSSSPSSSPLAGSRMRRRLSSLLIGSTDRLPFHGLFPGSKRKNPFTKDYQKLGEEDSLTISFESGSSTLENNSNEQKRIDMESPTPLIITSAPPQRRQKLGLAELVRAQLGSVMEQVDEEIEREWEQSRNLLHQSLLGAKSA